MSTHHLANGLSLNLPFRPSMTQTILNTSKSSKVLIIADAHLPLDGRKGASATLKSFRNLIEHHSDSLNTLVLLGDTFDFWYDWNHVVPKRAFTLLTYLRNIVLGGIDVHLFAGNHDFRVKGFLEDEVGLSVHMDEWRVKVDGKVIYFHHGDGFAVSDSGYRNMKKIFRHPLSQFLFGNFFHPDLAMSFGKWVSQLGRSKGNGVAEKRRIQQEYVDAAEGLIKEGNDIVIFGHTHLPKLLELESGWYHNPGPFLREKRYSLIDGGLPHSEVWAE